MANAVTMSGHIGALLERIRKNANKSKGPFKATYTISGDIEAEAMLDGAGDIALSAAVQVITVDGAGEIEFSRTGEGVHAYTLQVETMNDDWVAMRGGNVLE